MRRGDSCVVPLPGLRASRRKAANTPQLSCPTACTCRRTCRAIANWWRSGLLTSEELADALAPLNENELSYVRLLVQQPLPEPVLWRLVDHKAEFLARRWPCSCCTLINDASRDKCEACDAWRR